MAVFKKSPICASDVERGQLLAHNMSSQAIPAPDGRDGFIWQCFCGEQDGVWDQPSGAGAGLTQHMTQHHGLTA